MMRRYERARKITLTTSLGSLTRKVLGVGLDSDVIYVYGLTQVVATPVSCTELAKLGL